MSMLTRVAQFARSPQGRRLAAQAKRYAERPESRRRIEQVRSQLTKRARTAR